jgi:hypothetical protein
MRPGKAGACSMSHSAAVAASLAGSSSVAGSCGTTIGRSLAFGASTPWDRMRCNRGRGTSAASRCMNSSGLITGRPAGPPSDILWGFLTPGESVSYGRPVGVAIGPGGQSLLVADDVGDVVWRVSAA